MAITALSITLFFAGLGLVTALLVAVHDLIEGWFERRSLRVVRGNGQGGLPLPQAVPGRGGRRARPAPLPVVAKQAQAPLEQMPLEQTLRPAWLENAQRDIAHR